MRSSPAGCPSPDRRLQRGVQIETRYARNGETTIAWTAAGDAPTDLLFIPGFISHVEHLWEQPGLAGFFERLMGFSRLLIMDRRGCGLSDPRHEALSLEDEARDVLAVLDAAGSERAVLMGYTTGGPLAITTAALAPERVQALVLYASMARAARRRRRRLDLRRGRAPARCGRSSPRCGARAPTSSSSPRRAPTTRGCGRGWRAWSACPRAPASSLRLMSSIGDHDISAPARRAARPDADPAPHGRPPDRRAPLALPGRAHPGRALRRARGRRQPAGRGRQLGHARRDRGVPHRRALAHGRRASC